VRERLQKILARAGYGSRRSSEALITSGRVRVNGAIVSALGSQADPDTDTIEVDGKAIALTESHVYLVMHKPPRFVTTARDPQGRRTVMELLPPGLPPHVVPIGRLDRDTEGVLLFTSDGEFAHRMAHPRYEIEKEYAALVEGSPNANALERLRAGIEIEGRMTRPALAEYARPPHGHHERDGHTWLRIVIHEGRKRQVRVMCAAIGHPVHELVRTRIGGVVLARLPAGKTRPLSARELGALRGSVGLADG
jgi:23S rRNA pseudouridine2605 synthase